MHHHRLIPVILLKNGMIVRSELFKIHQVIGNPVDTIRRLSNWNVDELVLLDISTTDHHDLRRDDLFVTYDDDSTLGLLKLISKVCSMPLAFGGRIRTLQDMRLRLESGADKCVINSQAVETPELISQGAAEFGNQCIVVSIDVLRHEDGSCEVYTQGGKHPTGLDPVAWAKKAEALGAGEIFLNSVDRDGMANGYDLELVKSVAAAVKIPVIACGGVGNYQHFVEGIKKANASAVAAANIFNFFEIAYPNAKRHCIEAGVHMRPVKLGSKWFSREPIYDEALRAKRINDRLARAKTEKNTPNINSPQKMSWCKMCTYPIISATPLAFGDDGLCTGCRTSNCKFEITDKEWERRKQLLVDLLEKSRCPKGTRHDCVIGVSGGKDSYFQTHFIKNVLGYNPLLVTYYGNNYSEVGQRNLLRMKEAFDVDHIIYQPSVNLLKKLNRLGVIIMGDMNWHGHVGIATTPMKIATLHKIPLVIWGEHGYQDLCGQFSMNDFVEWSYRNRLEHFARGYEWNYMVGLEDITARDMAIYQYPSDQEIYDIDLRGVYLSNYTRWEANDHIKLVVEKYGFEVSDDEFDRTYRKMSNLDDIHENGGHDYLKYIKFGYGRCTDHTTKDIRSGRMTREQGVELVRKYDPVKPHDLKRWFEYAGMSEEDFDAIANTYRDRRVWWKEDGVWKKRNIWDRTNE